MGLEKSAQEAKKNWYILDPKVTRLVVIGLLGFLNATLGSAWNWPSVPQNWYGRERYHLNDWQFTSPGGKTADNSVYLGQEVGNVERPGGRDKPPPQFL